MDEDHSLFFFGLDANAIVDEDGTGSWRRAGKQLLLRWGRTHGFLACPTPRRSKKRTGLGPHPEKRKSKPVAVPERSAEGTTDTSRSDFVESEIPELTIADSKSGQV